MKINKNNYKLYSVMKKRKLSQYCYSCKKNHYDLDKREYINLKNCKNRTVYSTDFFLKF